MDPGIAGTVAAAAWCLRRFHRLHGEQLDRLAGIGAGAKLGQALHGENVPRRSGAASLRSIALSWCAIGVMLAGASSCAVTAAAMSAAAVAGMAAGVLYLSGCASALTLLAIVEGWVLAYRTRLVRDAAKRRGRRMSVRTLMRTAPHSRSPV